MSKILSLWQVGLIANVKLHFFFRWYTFYSWMWKILWRNSSRHAQGSYWNSLQAAKTYGKWYLITGHNHYHWTQACIYRLLVLVFAFAKIGITILEICLENHPYHCSITRYLSCYLSQESTQHRLHSLHYVVADMFCSTAVTCTNCCRLSVICYRKFLQLVRELSWKHSSTYYCHMVSTVTNGCHSFAIPESILWSWIHDQQHCICWKGRTR